MTDARRNTIDVIIGRKGSGKSTFARELLRTREKRIILDPMREHVDGAVVDTFAGAVAYLDRVQHGRYSVIVRALDPEEELRVIALTVAGDPERPLLPGVTLLVDEIDRLCSPNSIPPALFRLVNYGRHFGVSLVAVCRRPRRMHRDITAAADRIHIGETQEPADLDYLAEFTSSDLQARVVALPVYKFITWPDDFPKASPAPPAPAPTSGP